MRTATFAFVALACLGCNRAPDGSPDSPASATAGAANPMAAPPPPPKPEAARAARAEVGKPAPDFTLKDLDGKETKLSSLKGKTVVLEWWNPGCPFVKKSHTKGSLKEAAKRATKDGAMWYAVNSSAPGREGHGDGPNREMAKAFGIDHPILIDEAGMVGKTYGATNTPHMMVIDAKGTLVYRGAIDNSPDGEGESPDNGKLVRYVDAALADLAAGRAVQTAETKAYGCSVKFAK